MEGSADSLQRQDVDILVADLGRRSAVDLHGDFSFRRDGGIVLGEFGGQQAIEPEADAFSFAADDELVPSAGLQVFC
jgi:hypothetical protein